MMRRSTLFAQQLSTLIHYGLVFVLVSHLSYLSQRTRSKAIKIGKHRRSHHHILFLKTTSSLGIFPDSSESLLLGFGIHPKVVQETFFTQFLLRVAPSQWRRQQLLL